MKSTYAPELPISGWYMGGTPANLTSMILLLNKSLFSAFVLGGITGIVDTYPQASDLFDKVATKEGQKALSFARTNCLLDDLVTYPFQDVFSEKYSSLGEAFLTHPDVKPILNSLTMGYDKKYTPDAPILMVHGKADEISPYDSAKKSAQDWCNNGADVEFHTYDTDLSAHFITQITATAKSYVWLTDRLDGKPANSGCKFTSSQDVILDPNALGPGLQNILDILTGLAGDQIGPGDAVLAQKIRNGN
ncbi:putative secretory lipase (family lip) [Malassezia pachydermatis]|uniref:triacylglycerol lipase n=1 Tax=Malassezia pachydermatis TaxID=77020 RepID=A0A0N0RS25_9BASI|nr:putative secretory lipase (family lip) [Malassezia pachydermatis]KOS13472.1 putative secretory lipase (family lip) [Malassezia pachydermatis]